MTSIRRLFFLFFVLLIGIFLGNLGLKTAFLIVVPIFLILIMLWDEASYRYTSHRKQQNTQREYHYR
ncbi:hypothetical protein ACWN8V_05420 [Vagococcus elongatus]|uniref:Uncharacterized protein n=1 Tax=Vagococcus elongatus TaxID=180344 RepID=A0A430AX17_9ENTE|nr:hypothetical protein [Vagococcus elongatus]RSU12598.1 hypothetical protein CBF29_05560 [Vagococcus elongatus]